MTNPFSRAGRIVLVEDVTRSDRAKLPPVQPDGGMVVVALIVFTLVGLLAGLAIAALVLA